MAQRPPDDTEDQDREHGVEKFREVPAEPRIGTALIEGNTFTVKAVQYVEIDGMAIVEGDIALGTVEEIERATEQARDDALSGAVAFGVGITGDRFRWPNCRVAYEIDPALPNQQRVTNAIAHWQANTAFRFAVRTNESNWIYFTDDGGCWSLVGMRGGRQTISLGTGCTLGNTIHEIGHAIGLWHEQSREDRDQFVRIQWQNIQSGMASQFQQHIVDGDDLGGYDYGSIMHYPRTAFSANGQATIVPVDANAQIGQRNGLSPGDIAAVRQMYPGCYRKLPQADPPKPIIDGPRFKKLLDDERRLKIVRDPPKVIRDVGPRKPALDPRPPIGGPVINPRLPGQLPFSLASGHQAAGFEEPGGAEAGIDAAIGRQLLEMDAAIGRLQATIAESTLDLEELLEARMSASGGGSGGGS